MGNGTTTVYVDKDVSGVATSIGLMLLGMVTFTMSLFYATHFPDPDVQHATWLTLSEAVSLFTAVLMFTSFKDIMVLQFGETGGHHHGMPDLKSMIQLCSPSIRLLGCTVLADEVQEN